MKYSRAIGVSILTNGNRRQYLDRCIGSLIRNCSYRPLVIGIWNNGSTDDTQAYLDSLLTLSFDGITFRIQNSTKDLGCAVGTNMSCAVVGDCEFQLHLESDFELLSPEESGEDGNWLNRAVDFMEEVNGNYLYLRRMTGEKEMMDHWWSQWMSKIIGQKGPYLSCPSFWWSNNPALFRTKAMYDGGTLPLRVDRDGPKGTPGWSRPELETKAPGRAMIHQWGLFVHERQSQGDIFDQTICRKGMKGLVGCKYGFFKTGSEEDRFCGSCHETETFKDMKTHEGRFLLKQDQMGVEQGKKFTIVTVDNGWCLTEFLRITKGLNARRIVMAKGNAFIGEDGVESIQYDESLDFLIKYADVAFFPKVGEANKVDYLKLVKAGVPVVVQESYSQGAVEHEKTGWVFRDEKWALHWLTYLKDHPEVREQRRKAVEAVPESTKALVPAEVIKVVDRDVVRPDQCMVTVITPTFHRDLKVIRRCINSMLLQTVRDWEQIICSDGENETQVKALVDQVADKRIRYEHTAGKKSNDFGNTVRSECLKKARGKFVLFFDDDNLILPHYLQTMIRAISESNKDYAVCKIMHFGPLNQSILGRPPKVLTGNPVKLYHIDPLQVLVRTRLMQSVGWDTMVGYLSDGVTLERLGAKGDPVWVEEVLGIHV
jgi:glycosyltransferase involved in cell wall biosynthesis